MTSLVQSNSNQLKVYYCFLQKKKKKKKKISFLKLWFLNFRLHIIFLDHCYLLVVVLNFFFLQSNRKVRLLIILECYTLSPRSFYTFHYLKIGFFFFFVKIFKNWVIQKSCNQKNFNKCTWKKCDIAIPVMKNMSINMIIEEKHCLAHVDLLLEA